MKLKFRLNYWKFEYCLQPRRAVLGLTQLGIRVRLSHVKAHAGLWHHDLCDKMAKATAKHSGIYDGLRRDVSVAEVKKLLAEKVRSDMMNILRREAETSTTLSHYKAVANFGENPALRADSTLSRREEIVLHRMRVGSLNLIVGSAPAHLDSDGVPSRICPCCESVVLTAAHVLFECPCLCGARLHLYASMRGGYACADTEALRPLIQGLICAVCQ